MVNMPSKIFVVCFWLICQASLCFAQSESSTFSKTLTNGLTVVVLADRSLPTITVSWGLRENTAVLNDTSGGLGLINALMFNSANASIPSAALIHQRFSDAGIRYAMQRGDA